MSEVVSVDHKGCHLVGKVRGNGPPVVMIQGVGLHGDGWRPQIDGLSHRYRCLSFDNRGMGESQPLGSVPFTIEQMAEDVGVLMDAMKWDSAHIVGHSMGGLIALQFALSARARVKSLSLLCTFARGRDGIRFSLNMLWTGLRTRIGTRRQRRRAFLEIVMPAELLSTIDKDAMAVELAPLFGHDLAEQPAIAMKQLSAMQAYNATPKLKELKGLPTLVMTGAHDLIAPPFIGRKMADDIPDARYLEFGEAAHGLPIQCADKVNKMLDEHFSQV